MCVYVYLYTIYCLQGWLLSPTVETADINYQKNCHCFSVYSGGNLSCLSCVQFPVSLKALVKWPQPHRWLHHWCFQGDFLPKLRALAVFSYFPHAIWSELRHAPYLAHVKNVKGGKKMGDCNVVQQKCKCARRASCDPSHVCIL